MRNIDWPYSSTLGVTLACMLVLWIWAGQIPIPEEDLGIDDIPDRFAKMVMPDKLMEDDEGEGEGAGGLGSLSSSCSWLAVFPCRTRRA